MEKRKKVIILYSTAGLGHKKAAVAIGRAFEEKAATIDVELVDFNDYANRLYKFLYMDFYVFMMTRAKWLWAVLYYVSNFPLFDTLTRSLREALDYRSFLNLAKWLKEKDPDVILATHFLLSSMAKNLREDKKIRAKMYVLVTDYGPHSYWLSDHIDKFFVGAEFVTKEFKKRHVPEDKIIVTGIATSKEFHEKLDPETLRQRYGIDKNKRTIFLMSGGFGVGPLVSILSLLDLCKADIQVITVCGYNKAIYEKVNAFKARLKYPVISFGFTDKVAELMTISDLMITKAGGISVTEALNTNLPMIFYGSIPGQETWNEMFLLSNHAAVKAERMKEIPGLVDEVLLDMDKYDQLKENIGRVRKPFAAEVIVNMIERELSNT
ncbi:MAG: glycosyltransferase [Candidatus Omnitrophica bacterium]|nr:glycosyltransferase [Candidatus Omnitrophota bacterium]